ncbi:28636_t:CDS:2, partial [Dentiscutata erythropus]
MYNSANEEITFVNFIPLTPITSPNFGFSLLTEFLALFLVVAARQAFINQQLETVKRESWFVESSQN